MATQTRAAPPNSAGIVKYDGNAVCSLQQLGAMFTDAVPKIQKALPPAMRNQADRLVRVAMTAIANNPTIAKCTGFSILDCFLQASTQGLEIGGVLGQSYMVPYGNKATFQIGYRGLIALAYRSGQVSNIFAQVVRDKDRFRMLQGTSPGIDHEPSPAGGQVIGAYAVIVYKSGQISFEYMTRDEIEHHRRTYSKQGGDRSPWATAWNEMAKKTVVRRLLKYAPLGIEFPADAEEAAEVETVEVTPAQQQLPPAQPPGDAGPETDEDGNPIGQLFGGQDSEQVPMH